MPAASDPDLAARLAKETVALYGDSIVDLLQLVARRLSRGLGQPDWAERRLLDLAGLRDQAQNVVDRLERQALATVTQALTRAAQAGAAAGARDVPVSRELGQRGQQAVAALVEETVGRTSRTHSAILRQTVDVYRTVIAEASGLPLTGARTRRDAAQSALDRFADRGVAGFVDRAGRRWDLASYTEMALRTSVGRAQVHGALDRFAEGDRDLVLVSVSPEPCPVCTPWEDQILSISGADERYPSVADAEGDGLLHPNCTHRMHAWVPGLSEQVDPEPDPEDYERRQEQRHLERGIRRWKQRQAVALDDQAKAKADAKVNEWQGRMRGFLDDTDRIRRTAREQLAAR